MIQLSIIQFITVLFATAMGATIVSDAFAYWFKKRPKIITHNINMTPDAITESMIVIAPALVKAMMDELSDRGDIILIDRTEMNKNIKAFVKKIHTSYPQIERTRGI